MLASTLSDTRVVDQRGKGSAVWARARLASAAGNCADGFRRPRVHAAASRSGGWASGDLRDPWREEEHRQALLKYVQEVQPHSVVQFAEQTHPVVVQAMRQTVLNIVGGLPPQYFDVRISTVAESLAQLMLSIMTTGYMLRSAQYRMELQNALKQLPAQASASTATAAGAATAATTVAAAVVDVAGGAAAAGAGAEAGGGGPAAVGSAFLLEGPGSEYAPGVQKKSVQGEVLRWHVARGEVERLPAERYIELLEAEVARLRAQQAAPPPFPASPLGSPLPGSPFASSPNSPLATSGSVEVLGPDPLAGLAPLATSSLSASYVSPLPGFGERRPAAGSAAAPESMGSGGVPLVVGSPLGLPRNELLEYLHTLQASGSGGFKELACSPTAASGEAVKEAMELFVGRLMGTADPGALSKLNSEFTAVELSKVLFWLMAVGYTLKTIEARLEVEDGMGGSGGGGSGPRGSGGGSPTRGGGGGGGGGSGSGGSGGGGNGKSDKGKGLFGKVRGLLPGF